MKFLPIIITSFVFAIDTARRVLIKTGRDLDVLSIKTGTKHQVLQEMAEEHANFQARVQQQSHRDWGQRVLPAAQRMPNCNEFAEVVNESWPGQDVNAAAKEMYASWKKSPGHWSCVNGRCNYWGYAMVRGKNGVWYACGEFAKFDRDSDSDCFHLWLHHGCDVGTLRIRSCE